MHAIDATSTRANRFFLGLGLGGVHLARPAGDEHLEPLPGRLRRPPLAVYLDAVHLVYSNLMDMTKKTVDEHKTVTIKTLGLSKGEELGISEADENQDLPPDTHRVLVDFIEKPFDPNRILEAVRGCLSALARQGVESEAREQTAARLASLTPRERQVFDALIDGKSNKEIALALDISPRTVEIFRAKVMQKMQAQSLSMLVRLGLSVADA